MSEPTTQSAGELRKDLGPWTLWGLGVGYVISGEYFGWNLGLPLGGTYGLLLSFSLVTLMYVAFVFSYAEMACAIPRAGGAFVYAARGLGPGWGNLAGLAQVLEFVFAPPAIALAIGAYVNTAYGGADPRWVAAGAVDIALSPAVAGSTGSGGGCPPVRSQVTILICPPEPVAHCESNACGSCSVEKR